MGFTGNRDRLRLVLNACIPRNDHAWRALRLGNRHQTNLGELGVAAGEYDGRTVGAHCRAQPHGGVSFLIDQVVFGARPNIVHIHAVGPPRIVRHRVHELLRMVNEERPAANIRDGIGQELAGFQVEEALLVTFVAFLINRNAQELTVT